MTPPQFLRAKTFICESTFGVFTSFFQVVVYQRFPEPRMTANKAATLTASRKSRRCSLLAATAV
jgi:hypothetical protein